MSVLLQILTQKPSEVSSDYWNIVEQIYNKNKIKRSKLGQWPDENLTEKIAKRKALQGNRFSIPSNKCTQSIKSENSTDPVESEPSITDSDPEISSLKQDQVGRTVPKPSNESEIISYSSSDNDILSNPSKSSTTFHTTTLIGKVENNTRNLKIKFCLHDKSDEKDNTNNFKNDAHSAAAVMKLVNNIKNDLNKLCQRVVIFDDLIVNERKAHLTTTEKNENKVENKNKMEGPIDPKSKTGSCQQCDKYRRALINVSQYSSRIHKLAESVL